MVGLDGSGRPFDRYRLNHVRIESALDQILDATVGLAVLQLQGFLGENGNELIANDLSLFLRIGDAFKLMQEAVGSVYADDVQSQTIAQHLQSVFEFVF